MDSSKPIKQGQIEDYISDSTQTALNQKQSLSEKGAANGYASLDGTGRVPSAQLPSYVDDVLEFPSLASFPLVGSTGIIYVALDTNKTYRWSGSVYVELSSPSVSSVFGRTGAVVAVNGDYTTALVPDTLNKRYQTDNQQLFNDATSSIQTQLNNRITGAGSGTTNQIPKWSSSTGLTNSNLSDNGTIVTSTTDMSINGLTVGRGGGNQASNTVLGPSALLNNISAGAIVAIGTSSLSTHTTGSNNTAVGHNSLSQKTTGGNNIAVGTVAGMYIADGTTFLTSLSNSTYLGANTKASANGVGGEIVIGYNAIGLGSNTSVLGSSATTVAGIYGRLLVGNTTLPADSPLYQMQVNGNVVINAMNLGKGANNLQQNTFLGEVTGLGITSGNANTGIGFTALRYLTSGGGNTALGGSAGVNGGDASILTTTSNSIFIGQLTKASVNGNTNEIVIGYNAVGNGSNTVTIGNSSILNNYFNGALNVTSGGTFGRDIIVNGIRVGIGAGNNGSSTAIGITALGAGTGNFNVGVGYFSLASLTTGGQNVALGSLALNNITNGTDNIGIGYSSGRYLLDGSTPNTNNNGSIYIGRDTKSFATGQTNEIVIGHLANGNGTNSVTLGSTAITKTILQGNTLIGTTTDNGVDRLQVNGSILATNANLDAVTFKVTPTVPAAERRVLWDDNNGVPSITLKGGNVNLLVGETSVDRAINKQGSNVLAANYQVVYVSGGQGNKETFKLAQANATVTSVGIIGLVAENINNNQEGFIISRGTVNNINTSGSLQGESWVDGDIVYLSPTVAGGLTKVKPISPNRVVRVGIVTNAHNTQGSITVGIAQSLLLSDLNDTLITSPIDGQLLTYESSTSLWKNKTLVTAQPSTGAINFTSFTQGVGNTINIGAVSGYVVDNETTPGISTPTAVNYAGGTNIAIPTIGSGIASYVTLNSAGALQFYNTLPDSEKRRKEIYLGKIGHPTGTINIVAPEPDISLAPFSQLRDWAQAITYINRKVGVSPNGANLQINLSAGTITGAGINYVNNKWKPNDLAVAAQTAFSFLYRTQTGNGSSVSAITPGSYDVAGTVTAIPGSPNRATLQYIWFVPNGSTPSTGGSVIIQYGQQYYSSLSDAIAAIGKETRITYPSLVDNAIILGILAVTSGATNLQDTTQAQFFPASKFGEVLSVSAGAGVDSRPYKSYVSIISQSGTSAPTVLTRENSIGAIVWSRNGAGDYLGTLAGAFTADKTFFNITKSPSGAVAFTGLGTYSLDPLNVIQLRTYNSSGTPADSLMSGWYIEVRVYN